MKLQILTITTFDTLHGISRKAFSAGRIGKRKGMNGTNKGVPDFCMKIGDSTYIDKDKIQWAKYTNPLGARFYTAEEMQREMIVVNQAKLTKLNNVYLPL